MYFSSVPQLIYHDRLITYMKSRHGGILQSHLLPLPPIHSQAKKIMNNVNRYFIAEKVSSHTLKLQKR